MSMLRPFVVLAAVGLTACATQAPTAPTPVSPVMAGRGKAAADAAATARALQSQDRPREALWWWRVALVANPGSSEATSAIAALQAEIDQSVSRWMAEGDRLRRKGAVADAQAAYQRVLWLDPSVTAARDALRGYDANAKLRAIARGGGGGPAAARAAD